MFVAWAVSYWVSRLYGSDNLLMGFYSFINILYYKEDLFMAFISDFIQSIQMKWDVNCSG